MNLADFWHLTPHDLFLIAEGRRIENLRQIEYDNAIAHLQGMYIVEALLTTVGNMFSDKNSKKHDYPDKPYDLNLDSRKNEREKQAETDNKLALFTAQLSTAMANFNLSHSKPQDTDTDTERE